MTQPLAPNKKEQQFHFALFRIFEHQTTGIEQIDRAGNVPGG
ncbi:MAG: hypothetical protein ABSG62_20870 [Terracidiphilus sp.]